MIGLSVIGPSTIRFVKNSDIYVDNVSFILTDQSQSFINDWYLSDSSINNHRFVKNSDRYVENDITIIE